MLLSTLTVSAAVTVYVMLCTGCVFKHTGMKVAPSKLMIRRLQARWMDFKGRLGWFFLAGTCDRQDGCRFLCVLLPQRAGQLPGRHMEIHRPETKKTDSVLARAADRSGKSFSVHKYCKGFVFVVFVMSLRIFLIFLQP